MASKVVQLPGPGQLLPLQGLLPAASASPASGFSLWASLHLCGAILFLGPWGGGPMRASMSS